MEEGSDAKLTITPDEGYRVTSVKEGEYYVTVLMSGDARFKYEITNADVKTVTANYEVRLGGSEKVSVFKVSVRATKDGYSDSDEVTMEIKVPVLRGDVNADGKVNVADHVIVSSVIMEK